MDLHERQQFDMLLELATERFAARLEEQQRGAEPALASLQTEAGRAACTQFVAAFFQDMLLDSADGAAFVLRALPKRPVAGHRESLASAERVDDLMQQLARAVFADLLANKTAEQLQRHAGYMGGGNPAVAANQGYSR